jgi:hypothetical protein
VILISVQLKKITFQVRESQSAFCYYELFVKNRKSQPNPRPAFLQGTGDSMALPIMEFKAQTQHDESYSKLNHLLALKREAHFTGWGSFWTFSRFPGIFGTPRDHPGGYGLVSRCTGGKEKKKVFSDFGMNAVVHRKISKEESVKSFVSKCSKCSK